MPYLPALSVISALGVNIIRKNKIRRNIILFIVFLGLTQFFFVSYMHNAKELFHHIQITPGWRKHTCDVTSKLWDVHFNINVGLLQADSSDWKIGEIIEVLMTKDVNRKKTILSIRDHIMISDSVRTQIVLEQLPFEIIYADGAYKSVRSNISDDELTSLIISADYIFISTFGFIENSDITDKSEMIFKENIEQFQLLSKMALPDATIFCLYENKKRNNEWL